MNKRDPFAEAVAFHYAHGGFSFNPKVETEAEGEMRCAIAAATAEIEAKRRGLVAVWEEDGDGDHSYTEQVVETCEYVTIRAAEEGEGFDKILASLGCVDDADDNFRRVTEADLFAQAIAEQDKIARMRAVDVTLRVVYDSGDYAEAYGEHEEDEASDHITSTLLEAAKSAMDRQGWGARPHSRGWGSGGPVTDVYWVAVVTPKGDHFFAGPFDGKYGAEDAERFTSKAHEIGHRTAIIGQP